MTFCVTLNDPELVITLKRYFTVLNQLQLFANHAILLKIWN